MSSYDGDDFGAFLPGLMRVVKQPFKSAIKITKKAFKKPISILWSPLTYTADMLKAGKFAAMGSKPVLKKKPVKVKSVSSVSAISSTPSLPGTSNYIPSDYGYQSAPLPEPDTTPETVEQVQEGLNQEKPKKSIIPLIVIAGAAAFFMLKRKR